MTNVVSILDLPAPAERPVFADPPDGTPKKRPFPYMRRVQQAVDYEWDPVAEPLVIARTGVRAGTVYAVCRPGMERWPLGISSERYMVTSHRTTAQMMEESAGDLVERAGVLVSGHGYQVVLRYKTTRIANAMVAGIPVSSRLVLVHDNTASGSLTAAMMVYAGNDALGAVVRSRAMHAGAQPSLWRADVEAMVEKAVLAQVALTGLLGAAEARVLDDEARLHFEARGMMARNKDARTCLDVARAWCRPVGKREMSWNIWARGLEDDAILALVSLLGPATHGRALDEALGLTRREGEEIVGRMRYERA